jgi:pSer/pThr/pTyr-binding forkhead associated (FHA) protein
VAGPDCNRWISLSDKEIIVGSAEDCDLRLNDRKISKHHMAVRMAARGFLVRDLESRNGTFFQGVRVGEIAVPPGTTVLIGESRLLLSATEDEVEREPEGEAPFAPFQVEKKSLIAQFERDYLRNALEVSRGNIRQAARASGLERTQLKRLLDKHGLR